MKAIIFDMDGTLADTEPLHFLALKKTLSQYNLENEDLSEYIGLSEEDIWDKIKKNHNINNIEELEKKRKKYFISLLDNIKPATGIEKIYSLENKYNLALVSSSGRIIVEAVLKKLKLKNLFKITITGDDVLNKKPHPEPYIKVINLMNLSPSDCIAVEDSLHGLVSAKNAGIKTALLLEFARQKNLEADLIFLSLKDIIEYLK